ncbi:MAG: homocysteine S-methyltransferase [Nitriliruptoraceae bacterium]
MDTDAHDPLAATIARRGVAILDGGLATTLAARGADLSGGLWSARVLRERPELVREAHADFLRAGADVVISASYQVSVEGFRAAGIAQAEAERLLRASVGLAREARELAGRPDALVAASIGPYGAAQADGSEYHGDYDTTVSDLRHFHRWRLEVLGSEQPDLLAIETLPSAAELEVLLELLEEQPGPPAWITFACRDGTHLADGTPFAAAATRAAASARVVGVGINCTPPRYVAELLASLGPVPRATHLVVYPNLGDSWDPAQGRWVRRQEPSDLPRWRRLGADVIGGCCGTTPDDIRELSARLR